MKLNSKILAVIIFVILFGGIGFTTAMNWWQTESSKVPATFSEGEAAGEYNPADIRGSYTFADIENSFGIPAAELAAAFAVETDDPSSVAIKDLEALYAESVALGYEVGTASVRYFVALYTGLPYEISEETYLPRPAVEILTARGGLTADQRSYLQAHIVEPITAQVEPDPSAESIEVTPTGEEHETSETDRLIKGKTSFQEVLDWGVPQEVIERILGVGMPNPLTKIKDFCAEKALDFETIKPALQAEVDKTAP